MGGNPQITAKRESGGGRNHSLYVHPQTGLLHPGRWLVSISLGWHYRCHAGGSRWRSRSRMREQGRSSRWFSRSPLKLRCHVMKLNSQHGIKRWTFFHLTTTTSCVSLLFFQYLPYDIISNTNLIPESGAQSLGDSATGLFCCLTLVIYWPPWFTGLVGSRCVLFRESKARIYLYFISPFSREFRLSYRNIGGPRQWWGTPRD